MKTYIIPQTEYIPLRANTYVCLLTSITTKEQVENHEQLAPKRGLF